MRRTLLFAAALATALAATSAAAAQKPPELEAADVAKTQVGATSFRVMFWRVFDASLWSTDGRFDWTQPFALSLTYRRDFSVDQLKSKTVEEMARISGKKEAAFRAFGEEFAGCVGDVGDGDRITAVSIDADKTQFFFNGEETCTLSKPGLRRDFFSIWLSEDSLFPEASSVLVGPRS